MIVVEYAITLFQPWSSLMALGEKLIETRGRRTNYRGWIAIHAAKAAPYSAAWAYPFNGVLQQHGISDPHRLPRGAVVAVTRISDCLPIKEVLARTLSEQELYFGNYGEGRYGYLTEGLRRVREPIPMRGWQTIPWKMQRAITEADLI